MRILHVCVGLPDEWGGPSVAIATIARAQAARGDDVVVLHCTKTSGPQTLEPGDYGKLRVIAPPLIGSLALPRPALVPHLRPFVNDADVVHIHTTWRYHVLAAAKLAPRAGKPYFISPHGNLGRGNMTVKPWRKKLYLALIERRVLNCASGIHCCSAQEQRDLTPWGVTARSFVVPNPVETSIRDTPIDSSALAALLPGLRESQRVILTMGRVAPIKRLDLLLEAFVRVAGEFHDWSLVIAGPHEFADVVAKLRERIASAGLGERVFLPGMVRGAAKAALLSRSEIYAQASLHENFGLAAAEAMLMHTPCVVSSGVALAEDIAKADAGLVASDSHAGNDETREFATALQKLMSDESQRARQAANAARLAESFTPAAVADAFAREYAAAN